jgi:aspartyl/asparaginyl beta-hydroxylase (cupin superfamily)
MSTLVHNYIKLCSPQELIIIANVLEGNTFKYLDNNLKKTFINMNSLRDETDMSYLSKNNCIVIIDNNLVTSDIRYILDNVIKQLNLNSSILITDLFFNKNSLDISEINKLYKSEKILMINEFVSSRECEIINFHRNNKDDMVHSLTVLKKVSEIHCTKEEDIIDLPKTIETLYRVVENIKANKYKTPKEQIDHILYLMTLQSDNLTFKEHFVTILNGLNQSEKYNLDKKYFHLAKYYLDKEIMIKSNDLKKYHVYGDILLDLNNKKCINFYKKGIEIYSNELKNLNNTNNEEIKKHINSLRYSHWKIGKYHQNNSNLSIMYNTYKKAVEKKLWTYYNLRPIPTFNSQVVSSPFLDPNLINFKDFLERNSNLIKDEFFSVIQNKKDDLYNFETQFLTEEVNTWKEIKIGKVSKFRKFFPITVFLLDKIEKEFGLQLEYPNDSIKFSHLLPHCHIESHCGTSNLRVRVHLGLKIPKGCFIRCDKEIKTWEEGKILVLNDAYEHEVWNWSEEDRVVLIIDIVNPHIPYELKNKISVNE